MILGLLLIFIGIFVAVLSASASSDFPPAILGVFFGVVVAGYGGYMSVAG